MNLSNCESVKGAFFKTMVFNTGKRFLSLPPLPFPPPSVCCACPNYRQKAKNANASNGRKKPTEALATEASIAFPPFPSPFSHFLRPPQFSRIQKALRKRSLRRLQLIASGLRISRIRSRAVRGRLSVRSCPVKGEGDVNLTKRPLTVAHSYFTCM